MKCKYEEKQKNDCYKNQGHGFYKRLRSAWDHDGTQTAEKVQELPIFLTVEVVLVYI